jgi:hypothetical protein
MEKWYKIYDETTVDTEIENEEIKCWRVTFLVQLYFYDTILKIKNKIVNVCNFPKTILIIYLLQQI